MLEYRTERVSIDQENYFPVTLTYFGWKLFSSQEIYSEREYVVGGRVSTDYNGNANLQVNTATSVTHYVTQLFTRDTDIPNYKQLKELNDEFDDCGRRGCAISTKPPKKELAVMIIGYVLVALALIYWMICAGNGTIAQAWLVNLIATIAFSGFAVGMTFVYLNSRKRYEKGLIEKRQLTERAAFLCEQAKKILSVK